MAGNLRQDYEDSKGIVEDINSKLKVAKQNLKSSPEANKDNAKKEVETLEKELGEWEEYRDKLKHAVDKLESEERKIAKEEKVGAVASMIPGEGMILGAAVEADVAKKKAKLSTSSGRKVASRPAQHMTQSSVSTSPVFSPSVSSESPFSSYSTSNNASSNPARHMAQSSVSTSPVSSHSVSSESPFSSYSTSNNASSNFSNSGGSSGGSSSGGSSSSQTGGSSSRGRGFGKFFLGAIRRMSSNAKAGIMGVLKEIDGGNQGRRHGVELLFLFAIFVHLLDAFAWHFSLNGMYLAYRILTYLLLSAFACYVFNVNILEGLYQFFFKVSIVPVIIIPLISLGMNTFGAPELAKEIVGTVLLAIPWWLIYLRFVLDINYSSEGKTSVARFFHALITPSKWVNFYFFLLALALIFWLLTTFIIPNTQLIPGADQTGFNPGKSVELFGVFIKETGARVVESIRGIGKGIGVGYKGWKNETMSAYYTGQVEENKEATGIFITDLHITGKQYDSMPVVAYGYIKARSFVDGITINTSCYAQSVTNRSLIIKGKTDPEVLDNIYIEDQRGVICTFDSADGNNLSAGRYQLFLVLDFGFKTWAYKQYYFIDRGYYVYMKTSGDDPNTKLGIPKKSSTIYTNGPVMIGMDDKMEMPFAISSDTKNYLPMGMTIDDKPQMYGAKGQVVRVHNFTLRMPKYFTMGKCTYPESSNYTDTNAPEYKVYLFNNPNINLNGSFMTINCNVVIENESVAKILPNVNTPAMISVIGTSDYDYKLSKQIPVTVEKAPGT